MTDSQRTVLETLRQVDCPHCNKAISPTARFCDGCGLGIPSEATRIDDFVEELLRKKLKEHLKDKNVVEADVADRAFDRVMKWTDRLRQGFIVLFGVTSTVVVAALAVLGFGWGSLNQKIADASKDLDTRLQNVIVRADQLKIDADDGRSKLDTSLKTAGTFNDNVALARDQSEKIQARLGELNVTYGKLTGNFAQLQGDLEKMLTTKGDLQAKLASLADRLGSFERQQEDLAKNLREMSFADVLPRYIKYLDGIGFLNLEKDIRPVSYSVENPLPKNVGPSNETNAFYKDRTLYIHKSLMADQPIVVREYTEHALLATLQEEGRTSEVESALADYFSASFFNDPRIGGQVSARELGLPTPYLRTLSEDGKDDVKKRSLQSGRSERGEVWGRAFWQCRRDIGSDVVDKILFSAWKEAAPPNDAADSLRSFARKVVDLASKQDARSAECFTSQFRRRNLPL